MDGPDRTVTAGEPGDRRARERAGHAAVSGSSVEGFFARLRAREFSRLDAAGHTYLDYTGAGLYAERQIRVHADFLATEVLGNPHSWNPTSRVATERVAAARAAVLAFFRADPGEYDVIFTPNATGALKLVGESFPFTAASRFVLTADNHNSVNGIREYARAAGAQVVYVPLDPELRLPDIGRYLPPVTRDRPGLFAYPAQSNFTGVIHPLALVEQAAAAGYRVVLDAAAYVPTHALDLSAVHPDFVCISFYKMFGFPTGVGALLARRDALVELRRPWFAGGTARFAPGPDGTPAPELTGEAFEDGTLNFLGIAAVPAGLELLREIGMGRLEEHVRTLTAGLLRRFSDLLHGNGEPLVRVYGPAGTEDRGGTVAFNVVDPEGRVVDAGEVEERAAEARISLRTGGFCNPGAAHFAFDYSSIDDFPDFSTLHPDRFTIEQFAACPDTKPVGAVRVSFGIASVSADIDRLIEVLSGFRDRPAGRTMRVVPKLVVG
ncbi:MAG TPA: aminotransferase class V-fold PLP-dependent enzyme [Longimicrobiales bacterium]|nr:aminotransferase class V-fold PLP-dependent enzyme [Longimicrobiales bacterium]